MKSYRKELWFETPSRRAFINITRQIEAALKNSGIREGLALVNAMQITASVFINDDESGLHADYEVWLEGLAPHEPISRYRHNLSGEDNADPHLKRQVMRREVVVAVTAGKLDFGLWEQIFYGEFDGGRRKCALGLTIQPTIHRCRPRIILCCNRPRTLNPHLDHLLGSSRVAIGG
jgi:secondary thiamine-phosphate synthase enzyme